MVVNNENVGKGVLGALLGSLAGVLAIVLIGRLGYVAAISGVIMAFCTLTLYQKFAGGISKKGIIICAIIMVIMTIIGNHVSIVIDVQSRMNKLGYGLDFFKTQSMIFELMGEDGSLISSYIINLVLVLAFAVGGGFGILKTQFKTVKAVQDYNQANGLDQTSSFNSGVQPQPMNTNFVNQPVQPTEPAIQPQPNMYQPPVQPTQPEPQPVPQPTPVVEPVQPAPAPMTQPVQPEPVVNQPQAPTQPYNDFNSNNNNGVM